ncbi:MAG: nicotinate phosphoribosyltransferase [Alphaproteobacteria bacterium]|jgi:nicotinate phosphoribosyltransferase|nr:nicotinate phosphoribosyltransferase [Alphaproteobacteria bacterium]MDP6589654.1 nicotinate phosphoribosyltransferase [Alphaproteobacteria bacterium]MDP6817513.1 nicotinate phosphoribosyltransferase [Alphaproteobacteria bacterium]
MANSPSQADITRQTDRYFVKTREAVGHFGDKNVTYAVFMRRPVCYAPRLIIEWLHSVAAERGTEFDIKSRFQEGDWVGAGEPLLFISGPLYHLVDLETLYLQRLGAACVAAYNAYSMCVTLPKVGFMAMDARHCAGQEMAEMMAYAASVGSESAKRDSDAVGFIGNSNDATAHFFGNPGGLGTMPHAFIGYAGSSLRAAQMYREVFPDEGLTVLIDYFGQEITDGLEICRAYPELAAAGKLRLRLDTHGGRYVEGLDMAASYAVLEKHKPRAVRQYRSETELKWLIGTGVSAASIFHLRDSLDEAGFDKVKIIASSGFGPEKCKVMASAAAPIDVIGTGSFLPDVWAETYATADIVAYDGNIRVKTGREFLLRNGFAEASAKKNG